MLPDSINQPELQCQWCGGTIPRNESTCRDCGAIRPREDLTVSGFGPRPEPVAEPQPQTVSVAGEPEVDQEAKARQILRDLDAYVEEAPPAPRGRDSDPFDDVLVIAGILIGGILLGGLAGWFIVPPLLHDFFEGVIGVESEGPDAFRRLGAFLGGLIAMLFGALLAVVIRR